MDYQAAVDRANSPNNLIWHYTTLNALADILASNSLLATEVGFQNDLTERETADKAITKALAVLGAEQELGRFVEHARQLLAHMEGGELHRHGYELGVVEASRFVLCGSMEPDSLYIWRTYALGSTVGCAIGLDGTVPLGVSSRQVDGNQTWPRMRKRPSVGEWMVVDYDFSRVVDIAAIQLRELGHAFLVAEQEGDEADSPTTAVLIDGLSRIRSGIRSFAKNEGFADEREVRVTVEDVSPGQHVVFTPGLSGPRPHIRLVTGKEWGELIVPSASGRTAALLPILAVRLAPNAPRTAGESVKWLLASHGYRTESQYTEDAKETWDNSVLVLDSRHPFRSI